MAIDVELRRARDARAVIGAIGIMRREKSVEILRRASVAARGATSPLSSDVTLNDARSQAAIALTILIPALEAHQETPGQKEKAKVAVDAWIKELERARP